MDFWITVRALLKQWRFALPVYAFSLGMAAVVFLLVSTQYQSTGTLVLTSSASGARETTGSQSAGKINPLLAFDGSLTTTAQIVIQTLKDPANQKKYETVDGAPAGYEVGNGQLAGPFIVVVATAASPAAANKTAVSVLELARKELSDRQQSLQAPESTYIQADPVVNPTAGEAKFGPKVRYASFTLLLALMVALIAAYGLDSYKNYRASRP